MAAVTPKFLFGFKLVKGDPNLQEFSEGSTQSFNAGDPVKMSSGKLVQMTTPSDTSTTTVVESGFWGIAAKDASGTANTQIPVYVIRPEQVWEVHAKRGTKPSTKATYDEGKSVKVSYYANTGYTVSDGTSTSTTTVGAWYAASSAATSTKGIVIVNYKEGEAGVQGGRMHVRFSSVACAAQ